MRGVSSSKASIFADESFCYSICGSLYMHKTMRICRRGFDKYKRPVIFVDLEEEFSKAVKG